MITLFDQQNQSIMRRIAEEQRKANILALAKLIAEHGDDASILLEKARKLMNEVK